MLQESIQTGRFWLTAATLFWLAFVTGGLPGRAEAADTTDPIVDLWLEISDVVLARHVDPPTRQEMLKTSIQAACQRARQDAPAGLATQISRLAGDDEFRAFLRTHLDAVIAEKGMAEKQIRSGELRAAVIRGLLAKVTGSQGLIPLDEFYLQQQLRDNRYVGIGIQLGMKDTYPAMIKVFPHGPAWRAGGRDGDQIVSIDGVAGKEMPLVRVIELLRGQEGKPATVVVRRPGSEETQALNMVRGVVPFDTVLGTRRDEDQNWQYKAAADARIAYLKIESFRGSTPAELRRIAGRLHAEDCRGLLLDLRGTQSGELRYAVMVADLLLGAGPIGQVLSARGRQRYDSSADQLFPGWPLAVLIDGSTSEQAEWIAAALQDSGRGMLVGQPTAGQGAVVEFVELPGGIGGVRMNTGSLFRREGKPITMPKVAANLDGRAQMRRGPDGVLTRVYRSGGLKPDNEVVVSKGATEAMKLLQLKLGRADEPAAPADAPAGSIESFRRRF